MCALNPTPEEARGEIRGEERGGMNVMNPIAVLARPPLASSKVAIQPSKQVITHFLWCFHSVMCVCVCAYVSVFQRALWISAFSTIW